MQLIDSHAHLYAKEFSDDLHNVVLRAKDNGIVRILLPNIDSETISDMQALVANHPDLFLPMMGLHPTSVKENYKLELEEVLQELETNHYIAVGEIGIDLFWDKTFLREQMEAFEIQIEVAKKKSLPIVIHARDSFPEIFSVLDRLNDSSLKGVFHCFTGSVSDSEKILNYGGFKLGIGGVVTFKKGGIDQFLKQIPLSNIILETDSPYLPPAPFRGKRNESSYLKLIAEKVAEVYGLPLEEVAETTTQNCKNLFNI